MNRHSRSLDSAILQLTSANLITIYDAERVEGLRFGC